MTIWQSVLNVFGFVLPALAMAVFMPWAGRWVLGAGAPGVRRRMGVHAVAGVGVLLAGMGWHGQDGKMSTYMALVLVAATVEWWMLRGWVSRKGRSGHVKK